MTNQSRAEAYDAFDNFVHDWVEMADYAGAELTKDKGLVQDAIDAAVDEAYLCGYRDAKDRPNLVLKEKREDGSIWVINPDNVHDAICVHRAGDEL